MSDDDRELHQQLGAADPARALAPLPSTWLDHRMEQLMTDQSTADSTTATAPEAATPARPRIPRWMPVAGAA
ncbi:MAG: hypothetical protein Q7T17_00845, partial [Microbacterium sp.]|uniref:hypothetical protein n=1 Tax=Microbacterium sp. TaxID=51671 RepID=UPI00271F6C5C